MYMNFHVEDDYTHKTKGKIHKTYELVKLGSRVGSLEVMELVSPIDGSSLRLMGENIV